MPQFPTPDAVSAAGTAREEPVPVVGAVPGAAPATQSNAADGEPESGMSEDGGWPLVVQASFEDDRAVVAFVVTGRGTARWLPESGTPGTARNPPDAAWPRKMPGGSRGSRPSTTFPCGGGWLPPGSSWQRAASSAAVDSSWRRDGSDSFLAPDALETARGGGTAFPGSRDDNAAAAAMDSEICTGSLGRSPSATLTTVRESAKAPSSTQEPEAPLRADGGGMTSLPGGGSSWPMSSKAIVAAAAAALAANSLISESSPVRPPPGTAAVAPPG